MNKTMLTIGLAASFWAASQSASAQADTTFVSLFNGTDLTHWTTKSAATDIKNFATVTDGHLHIESPGGAGWLWLYSEKAYTDFILKMKFSAPTGNQGNSGVNFRSSWDPNDEGGFLNGPQVDIYTQNNWRTGCILDMTKGSQKWFFPSLPDWNITKANVTSPAGWTFKYFPEWNDLEIQVKGMNVKTIVNGILFANFNGEGILNDALHKSKNVGSTGYIALQAHAAEKVVIKFKEIMIADLSAPTALRAPRGSIKAAEGPDGSTEVFSFDGRNAGVSAKNAHSLRPGLYIVKKAGARRLQAVIR